MSRDRQAPSLAPPPEDPADLEGFPRRTLGPERPLFRVVREGRDPWWFGSSMEGRFDLPEPQGTCYLAADELGALLELLGPEIESGAVSARFLAGRRMREVTVPHPHSLADLTLRGGSGFGITAEIGTLVPYDLPQAWAARLHAAGADGLLFWLRHDPSRAEGFALFGPAGARGGWRRGRERALSSRLLLKLRDECGIEVLPVPRSDQLTIEKA